MSDKQCSDTADHDGAATQLEMFNTILWGRWPANWEVTFSVKSLLLTWMIERFWVFPETSGFLRVPSCSLEKEFCSERLKEEYTEVVRWMFSRTDMQQEAYWYNHKWKREGLEQRRGNMKDIKGGTTNCAKRKKIKTRHFWGEHKRNGMILQGSGMREEIRW